MFILLVQQDFSACKLYAYAEYLHSLAQLVNGRECRGDTDIAVLGILAIGECSAGAGHYNARLLGEGNDPLCAAGQRVEGNEVAAVRLVPLADSQGLYLLVEHIENNVELRADNSRMVLHVLAYALKVLEVLCVAELVELVEADGLVGHLALDEVDVLLACRNH